MTARRFLVLLAGLSAESRYAMSLRAKGKVITDRDAGIAYMRTVAARR